MELKVGGIYKVRVGYNCFVGCNVIEGGRVIEVTDSNIALLEQQKHKLENHETIVTEPQKIVESPKKPRTKKTQDKMVRSVRSK